MKVSHSWLQTYFDATLPPVDAVVNAFTFHAFEVDEHDADLMDIKILPNRAADCLSHRGIAKELAAILDRPIDRDPLSVPPPEFPTSSSLSIMVEDSHKCARYMSALVKGITIAPSPPWLQNALESVGQRSINNVVDITNYVMLSIGQPLHAFDAGKLVKKDGVYALAIRGAHAQESITTLSGDRYDLPEGTLVITDEHAGVPLALAGIKGGKHAEVTSETTELIIEAANFDGTSVRRTAQSLKLFTDASLRFQNRPSPEFAAYGMQMALSLIEQLATGEVVGVLDAYPQTRQRQSVSVSLTHINAVLGSDFSDEEVQHVFTRLGLTTKVGGEFYIVTPPFERTDLTIPEDLIEEVGRILGYERVAPQDLPPIAGTPDQARYRGIERMKDMLVEEGFIEVSTQSFTKKGDITLANPLDKNRPALRTSLEGNLKEALERAKHYAPVVLPPNQPMKLFEVGTVFPQEGEYLELRMTERVPAWGDAADIVDNLSVANLDDYGRDYVPKRYVLGTYTPFSLFPFSVRDIALWIPQGETAETTMKLIEARLDTLAAALLVKIFLFDQFEKEGRTSLAFRIVFQSSHRTLTDEEVNGYMEGISAFLAQKGYLVR